MEKEIKESKFKRYLLSLKKGWLIILILCIIGLLTGLIIADKTYKNKYEEETYSVLNFKYTEEISFDYQKTISKDNIDRVKTFTKSLETGNKITTYQYVEIKSIKIEKINDYYQIKAAKDSFNVSKDGTYSDSAAKGFLKHLALSPLINNQELEEYNNDSNIKGHPVFLKFDKTFYESNSLDSNGSLLVEYANPDAQKLNKDNKITYYTIWISSSFGIMLIISLLFIFIFMDKLDLQLKKEYDNENVYRHPFHLKIFKDSIKYFKDLKSIVFMSLLLGLVLICKFIPIPSGFGELGIGFSYLFLSLSAMIFGPIPALLTGTLSDILGYIIRPEGEFFIGYTIQAMVACFTYALCFHKTYVTFTRCLIARVIVNFLCNVIIGSVCRAIIFGLNYDAFWTYVLTISLPKNLVYLLPQSLLLFLVLKAMVNPLASLGLINEQIKTNNQLI